MSSVIVRILSSVRSRLFCHCYCSCADRDWLYFSPFWHSVPGSLLCGFCDVWSHFL